MRYMGCARCGYYEHKSHGSAFCKDCGGPLEPCTDSRDLGGEAKHAEYRRLLELRKKLGQK